MTFLNLHIYSCLKRKRSSPTGANQQDLLSQSWFSRSPNVYDNMTNPAKHLETRTADSLCALKETLCADLNFHNTNGSYGPHSWHPFPAKFPPQLPEFLIVRLSNPGDIVLDPMFGSGTTLVEAARLGRQAIGCDIDPLARIIAETKLTPIDPLLALRDGQSVLLAAKTDYWEDGPKLRQELNSRFDSQTRTFLDYWFLPQHQLELLSLLRHIEALPQKSTREFLRVVFSATIIAKSGGVSLARDLAHTRPHRDTSKLPGSAFVEFAKRLERNVAVVGDRKSHDNGSTFPTKAGRAPASSEAHCLGEIRSASAANTGLASGSVDLIVTSPPYANNAIDYMRAHKFSLVWFGWTIADLANFRTRYIGNDAVSKSKYVNLPDQCEKTITKLSKLDAKKGLTLRRYFGEMSAVIAEMRRVLKQGGPAVIIIGASKLRGIDAETHKGLAAIGESSGLELAGIGVRRLDRNRRMMPARWGDQSHSQIEARINEEYVVGLVRS